MVGWLRAICLTWVFLFIFSSSAFASEIKINEILVHPSSGNHEWVELYNPDKIDLSTYWIDDDTSFTDDTGGSAKKSLATIQYIDTQYPYIEITSSMFNNDGDSVVLFDNAGTIVDQYSYTKDPGIDISLGRWPDGSGDFAILSSATRGFPNTAMQPTTTLTPTKIPTATKTPTPTHSPTPTKAPAATNIPKITNAQIIKIENNTDLVKVVPSEENLSLSMTPSLVTSNSADAGVLATNISGKPTERITPKTIVKNAKSSNNLPLLIAFLGGGCLIVCGILTYKRIKSYER